MKLKPEHFPIDHALKEIGDALDLHSCLLIKAETGAGKTTRLPPYLLERTKGKILVLEPRRLAAKLSAMRCAETVNSKIGELVGHHIRFDKSAGVDTRLLFITEGLFLPYLREDPELSEFSTIIIDEFHERNIHTDLALALTRKLQTTTRADLKLIVMSATLETDKLESYLDSPKVFNISGRTYPIEIEYHPPQEYGGRRGKESWESTAISAITNLVHDPRCSQNILVFLPGMGAIRTLEQQLKSSVPNNVEIVPLHSTLPKSQQNKAFIGDKRKIILSTNIAETSLTIPNVTGVVDLGTERRASFAPWSGMPLLQLEKISKASATQRAGRAGRVQSGIVIRLYSESQLSQRDSFTPPEIKRVELSHHILDILDLGHHPDGIDWFEAPEEKNLKTALELLERLGAIKDSKPTEIGKFLAKLPLHPRLGAMLYECPKSVLSDALLAACVISEGMVLSKNAHFSQDDEEICDLCIQLDLIKAQFHKDHALTDYDLSYIDQKRAKRVIELYLALASKFKLGVPTKEKSSHKDLVQCLLKGFPDRIGAKREVKKGKRNIQSFNFCLGRGGKFNFKSALANNSPEFIIVLDALEDPKANAAIGTTIQAASKIHKEDLLECSNGFVTTEKESVLNEKKGTLSIKTITKYGKLTLDEKADLPVVPKGESLVDLMKENWPWPFAEDFALTLYNRRVKVLDQARIEHNCPTFEDEMFELFLESCVEDDTTYKSLLEKGLNRLIYNQLSPQDQYVLDHQAPQTIELENGKSFKIQYEESNITIEARIQDLYSITEHPHIAEGSLPLTIKLLSPANRVAQVVQDLPGFWKSSWSMVRKELKAKYPKHHWPENPEVALPKRILK